MERPLPVILVSVLFSAGVSYLVVNSQNPSNESDGAPQALESAATDDAVTTEQLNELHVALDQLNEKVAALESLSRSASRVAVLPEDALAENAAKQQTSATPTASALATGATFQDQVAQAVAKIEEEKEAKEWEEELEERRSEEVEAYEEYDQFNEDVGTRVVDLRDKLVLGADQTDSMRSLLAVQNDRNREMTRLWAEGKTSDEDLGEIFQKNRRQHRAELMALLGPEQLTTYRKYVRDGGLGGRFSFFVAPWEEWKADGED